jgi:predicted tellurium resistance membrane protein TerC
MIKALLGLFLIWVGLASVIYFPAQGWHFDAFGLMLAIVFSSFVCILLLSYVLDSEGKSDKE